MTIHSGLRAKNLLNLKVADLRGVKPGETLRLRRIVGAPNQLVLNSAIHRIFSNYLREEGLTDDKASDTAATIAVITLSGCANFISLFVGWTLTSISFGSMVIESAATGYLS